MEYETLWVNVGGVSPTDGLALMWHIPAKLSSAQSRASRHQGELLASAPGPVLDFGPERGPEKGTMADLGPLIRHLVSTRLPSGGRAALLSPLSPMHGTRPSV